ncbi:type II toxin-antitoxin system VapC family toxin [Roseateles koreensis]|uniref:Type II toxin-antitoxin system VapC family toxin n=1 Tax=Roseateles koreensis TaxID=2987526 RepID=A0ABT5KTW1_9BURK|nr:type II toxin-antitoxin system VapC family toxin [Roseateles koreensis]MDC8786369.1 type II toxin-antitoxin system VapC family toxin [Roseateles koreensis]
MNLLLDTHVALWAITANPTLSAATNAMIASPANDIWVSSAAIWEIGIKNAKNPAGMPINAANAMTFFTAAGYKLLSISGAHAIAAPGLPAIHNDPFDRMMIAQAQVENYHLVTRDALILQYPNVKLIQV